MGMRELLLKNPVIPAIKDEKTYKAAVDSPNKIVFIILSNLMEIENMVKVLKEKNKKVYIHIDMIEGLSSSNYVVDYVVTRINPDGIITTKQNIALYALKHKLKVIRRFFILDSFSLEKTFQAATEMKYTAIEILPGLMPKIIKKLSKKITCPIIVGGLIEDKDDIINAINAGALSISTTNIEMWDI